jgi:hypothetical protein
VDRVDEGSGVKTRVITYRCGRTGKLWEDRRPWGYSRWADVDELVSPDWEDEAQGRLDGAPKTLVCLACGGLCGPTRVGVEDVEEVILFGQQV